MYLWLYEANYGSISTLRQKVAVPANNSDEDEIVQAFRKFLTGTRPYFASGINGTMATVNDNNVTISVLSLLSLRLSLLQSFPFRILVGARLFHLLHVFFISAHF